MKHPWKIEFTWRPDANKVVPLRDSTAVLAFTIEDALKVFNYKRPVNCRILSVALVEDPEARP